MYRNLLKYKSALLILALVFFRSAVLAQVKDPVLRNKANVDNIRFGISYHTVLQDFQQLWGSPEAKDSASILYANKIFQGMKFDRIELDFQYVDSTSYFNQARFYRICSSKVQAVRQMKILAGRLSKIYPVSYDEEEGGTPFYKGGCAPVGLDDLFTVFVAPRKGRWTCQLRYGAFHYGDAGVLE
jgi:hypothetical protein